MNVLILSGAFGMGHNTVAASIAREFQSANPENKVEIVDLPEYLYPKGSKVIYGTFNLVASKFHGMYNMVNKIFEKEGLAEKLPGKVHKKVGILMDSFKPDVIICTLPLCARAIAGYKEKTGDNTPMGTCITDITTHSEWFTDYTDMYFVPTMSVKEKIIARGIPAENIHVTGIPVRAEFKEKKNIGNIKPAGTREILIMGGGLGLMPQLDSLLTILEAQRNVHITVITGNNKKAYEKLKVEYPTVETIGYTKQVSKYMKRADLLISKAGGITVFESIATETPLLVIKPFLEQELQNAKYLEEHGLGRVFWKDSTLEDIKEFIANEVEQERIKRRVVQANKAMNASVSDAVRLYIEKRQNTVTQKRVQVS